MPVNENQSHDDQHWFNAREHNRGDVQIYADIREQGAGKHKVNIVDLSQSGFRVYSLTYIKVDRKVFLTIPGYAPQEARIAWHNGDLYGCEFTERLHVAIYDHIIKQYPTLHRK